MTDEQLVAKRNLLIDQIIGLKKEIEQIDDQRQELLEKRMVHIRNKKGVKKHD